MCALVTGVQTCALPIYTARAEAVPGYAGTALPEGDYFDDPDRLEAAGASARQSSEPYRITVDGDRTRPAFSNDDILATTRREIGRAHVCNSVTNAHHVCRLPLEKINKINTQVYTTS